MLVPLWVVSGRVASVSGDLLVVGDPEHREVAGYSLSTGEALWQERLEGFGPRRHRWGLEVNVVGDYVYVSGDASETLDLRTMEREARPSALWGQWYAEAGGVCLFGGDEEVRRVDCETGALAPLVVRLPRYRPGRKGERPWAPPFVWRPGYVPWSPGDTVPVGQAGEVSVVATYLREEAALVGLDSDRERWRTPLPHPFVRHVARVGESCVAFSQALLEHDSALVSVDCADGRLRWSLALGEPWYRMWSVDETLVVEGSDGLVAGFDPDDGRELWRHDLGRDTHVWYEGRFAQGRAPSEDRPWAVSFRRLAVLEGASGRLLGLFEAPDGTQLDHADGTQILWTLTAGEAWVYTAPYLPPTRWALPAGFEGRLDWDGELLWAIEERGVRGVFDPKTGGSGELPAGWFFPSLEVNTRVPTQIPPGPAAHVGPEHIVLSRPDGYWRGQVGVFARPAAP